MNTITRRIHRYYYLKKIKQIQKEWRIIRDPEENIGLKKAALKRLLNSFGASWRRIDYQEGLRSYVHITMFGGYEIRGYGTFFEDCLIDAARETIKYLMEYHV